MGPGQFPDMHAGCGSRATTHASHLARGKRLRRLAGHALQAACCARCACCACYASSPSRSDQDLIASSSRRKV
jgi:hypothetical protein